MAGLMAKFNPLNRLLPKLLLAFWLTSMLSVGTVIGLPLLQKQWDRGPIEGHLVQLLDRVANRLDSNPQLSIEQVNRFLRRSDFNDILPKGEHPKHRHGRGEPMLKFYLVDANGNVIQQHSRRIPRSVREYLIDFDADAGLQQRQFGGKLLFGPRALANGHYLIGKLDTLRKPFLLQLWERPGWLLLLATIVSTLVFGLLAWSLSKPLRQLQATAGAIGQGDLNARIDPKISARGDEIGQLAQSFNRMADAVSTMVSSQQRLLSDISHELRTPLTRLQLSLAIGRRKGQQSDELSRISNEADTLEAMLKELLALSRLNMQVTERKAPLDLIQTLQPVFDGAQFEAQEAGKLVVVRTPDSLAYQGVDTLLQRMVENPLRNALRYANHKVHVSINQQPNQLLIQIDDDGPGVPEGQLQTIFKPFHRIDEARDRDSGGWGLGLAITQAAVEAHQGQLSASNLSDGGLRIQISLPQLG